MSKVNAPLLSFSATGQLAKAMVFFPWKGLNVVRKYIVPSNPDTALQQAQRALMKAAVDDFHAVEWTAEDLAALRVWAGVQPRVMTGPNIYVSEHIATELIPEIWDNAPDLRVVPGALSSLDVSHAAANLGDWAAHAGTSKFFFPELGNMTFNVGLSRWEVNLPGLIAGSRYYVWCEQITVGRGGRTGITSEIVA
jgi:hypothetical protein